MTWLLASTNLDQLTELNWWELGSLIICILSTALDEIFQNTRIFTLIFTFPYMDRIFDARESFITESLIRGNTGQRKYCTQCTSQICSITIISIVSKKAIKELTYTSRHASAFDAVEGLQLNILGVQPWQSHLANAARIFS